ncbi:MAG: transglutaminase-like domain-containing protein, partial [Defluviitaleaceae bacterium]|nr:transglutaminase-like domain-containing protein [Defluviitaleaceae bacterium]
LDGVTAGLYDVELMIALLNWVCDNFFHDGASEMPTERDAISIIEFMDENPRGINCRGLAILLAELLRLYDIPAKHITGHPMEHPARFVHVVTHAYSRELQQWIMLDPTFRLYLTDADGTYLDLSTLRKAFAQGDEVFPNENAGRNNQPFDMADYKAFMADYMFRFSAGTHFGFGAEDGREGNTQNMLAPVGYYQDPNVTTHNADAFWARP